MTRDKRNPSSVARRSVPPPRPGDAALTLPLPPFPSHTNPKQLLQDLAFPSEEDEGAFDVVFDDPDFAPEPPPPKPLEGGAGAAHTAATAAVALVALLLRRYRARQAELLAAVPDERLQLELALLHPLLEQEEEDAEQEAAAAAAPPPPPPRLQLRLAAPPGGGGRRPPASRACFSIPLQGVKRACLGALADYLGGIGENDDDDDDASSKNDNEADADIRGLALLASIDVPAPTTTGQNNGGCLRLSLAAPLWLRRAGLPPMPLPPLGATAASRPPLADYASDAAARLAAHLKAHAPRAAGRYALVDALAAVFGAAPLEIVVRGGGFDDEGAEVATPPPGADGGGGGTAGGGGGGGWSAIVARRGASSWSPSSSPSCSLAALFPLLLDAQPLLLAVEIGARFPDEQPLLRVTRAASSLGPGTAGSSGGAVAASTSTSAAAAAASGKRKASEQLAATGEAVLAAGAYPWSPRWPADEQAARIYNHLAAALAGAGA